MNSRDTYPTRNGKKQIIFPRQDPVIHSRNQQRWEGPLAEGAPANFERDGFLWFEGLFSQERVQPFIDDLQEMARDKQLMDSDQAITDPESGELRSVSAMHELSQRFSNLTRDPRI